MLKAIYHQVAIQVSRLNRQLMLFGKVELGQEKYNKELKNKFQEQKTTSYRRKRDYQQRKIIIKCLKDVAFTRHLQSKDFYLYYINRKLK